MNGLVVHFLGTITPREDVDRLGAKDRYPHTPANELQWSYVEALRGAGLGALHLFAAPAVSEFPRYPKILVSGRSLDLRRDAGITFIPCINLTGLKQVTQLLAAVVRMAPRLWRSRKARSVVLVYSLQSPFLMAAFLYRALLGVPVVVIIPDLSEYMDLKGRSGGLRALLKSVDVRLGRRLLARVDGAIVVARAIAAERLAPRTRYLVVDSIRDAGGVPSGAAAAPPPSSAKRSILYSGGLFVEYGVATLLDAFASLEDPDCELWLAGKGDLEPTIRRRMEGDRRIRFFGHLPLGELRALQSRASLLVSVKPSGEPFTRFSFPSKITEYMASGRPAASTACPAIDEEYFQYVHRLADESPEAMRQSIEEVFRLPPDERMRRAREGVAFLRKTRSPTARGRDLVEFLGSF